MDEEEYSFPTARSVLGDAIVTIAAVMLALDTLFVSMRLWGRRRYSKTPRQSSVSYGEPRYWVVVSDVAILFSYVCGKHIQSAVHSLYSGCQALEF